ncbi:MAG: hypothetical protein IPK35_08590 [Saprospiraceae bacterium]|nr:hypothetical protein [Saprospiraceae bacterium]
MSGREGVEVMGSGLKKTLTGEHAPTEAADGNPSISKYGFDRLKTTLPEDCGGETVYVPVIIVEGSPGGIVISTTLENLFPKVPFTVTARWLSSTLTAKFVTNITLDEVLVTNIEKLPVFIPGVTEKHTFCEFPQKQINCKKNINIKRIFKNFEFKEFVRFW